jgi:hypothetical protein
LNKFLSYNLQFNSADKGTNLFNTSDDLWSKENTTSLETSGLTRVNLLMGDNLRYSSPLRKLMTLYPNVMHEMGDDSDKKAISYPFRKLFKKSFNKTFSNRLEHSEPILNLGATNEHSSTPNDFIKTSIKSLPKTSKEFMIQYSYQSQPFSKQSVRRYKNLSPYTTNYNLSLGLNSSDSNLVRNRTNSNFITPLYKYNLKKTN